MAGGQLTGDETSHDGFVLRPQAAIHHFNLGSLLDLSLIFHEASPSMAQPLNKSRMLEDLGGRCFILHFLIASKCRSAVLVQGTFKLGAHISF